MWCRTFTGGSLESYSGICTSRYTTYGRVDKYRLPGYTSRNRCDLEVWTPSNGTQL